MSLKRRYLDSDDDLDVNPNSKRIRNEDGSSSAVNPSRYDPNFNEKMSSDDEGKENDNELNSGGMETDGGLDMGSLENGPSFDTLLYQLANMDVGSKKQEEEHVETCPICFDRVSLEEFPSHVYNCLDRMEDGDRNDLRTQVERDEELAMSLVQGQPYSYSQDMAWQCPICNKVLTVGMQINIHANECLDQQEEDDASSAMGKFSIQSSPNRTDLDDSMGGLNSPPGVLNPSSRQVSGPKSLTTGQMSACANALLSNPKGSQEYDSMLNMFETLGFNERNIRRVVKEGNLGEISPSFGDSKDEEERGGGGGRRQDSAMNVVVAPPPSFEEIVSGSGSGSLDRNSNPNAFGFGIGPGMFSGPNSSVIISGSGEMEETGSLDDIAEIEISDSEL